MPSKALDLFWVVLLPLSWFYSGIVSFALKRRKKCEVSIPVISVGNIHLGGTGKTPLVAEISRHFSHSKLAILSRGYKSQASKRGEKIQLSNHDGPNAYGDEPWMLAQVTGRDVFVGANRMALIKKFQLEEKCDVLVLDDGFQHLQIKRKVNLLVIPGDSNPWSCAVFPKGSLREPLNSLKRADGVVVTSGEKSSPWIKDWESVIGHYAPQTPVWHAHRKALTVADSVSGNKVDLTGKRVGAFCGIARPERFFNDLSLLHSLDWVSALGDHFSYPPASVEKLISQAKEKNLDALITTEKDVYKVQQAFKKHNFSLWVAQMEYKIPSDFWPWLTSQVRAKC